MLDSRPRVVIVGAGFGGLAVATALRKTAAQVTLIDRQNHHLFQPLLYQVATSVLSPAQIASPAAEHHGDPRRGHRCRPRSQAGLRRLGRPRGRSAGVRLFDSRDRGEPQLLRPRRIRAVRSRTQEPCRRGLDSKPRSEGLRAGRGGRRPETSRGSADLRAGGRRSHGRRDGQRPGHPRAQRAPIGVPAHRSHLGSHRPDRRRPPRPRPIRRKLVGRGAEATGAAWR